MATIEDFEKIDIRVGVIILVEDFPEARTPAYKLTIDFGPDIGTKRSAGRFTRHHAKDSLVGKKVLGVVNFPPRQIGPFLSECLTLGVPDEDGEAILIVPGNDAAVIGGKLF
jgi:tRNA-binding protein